MSRSFFLPVPSFVKFPPQPVQRAFAHIMLHGDSRDTLAGTHDLPQGSTVSASNFIAEALYFFSLPFWPARLVEADKSNKPLLFFTDGDPGQLLKPHQDHRPLRPWRRPFPCVRRSSAWGPSSVALCIGYNDFPTQCHTRSHAAVWLRWALSTARFC